MNFGYTAGTTAGTVDVPAGAKIKTISMVAGSVVAGHVIINGGGTIVVPAGAAFNEKVDGDVPGGADVIFGGTVQTHYVSWNI